MIEQSVSLASSGVVKEPGYEQLVRFGYTKNRGVYRLAVSATGEWEGLAIRAFWHVPDGKDPAPSLVMDGAVTVPALVTARSGTGCITFEGTDGGKLIASADVLYRVGSNSGTTAGTTPDPEPGAWQQFVDSVKSDAAAAQQAKTDAQMAAQQAEASASEAATSAGSADQSAQEAADILQKLKDGIANGDFKGEKGDKGDTGPQGETGPQGAQGPKGDPGPAVALDTTLTHEGEAADAKATGDAINAVKARQNILIGTETGNPLSVDDAFPAPLCGLTVYGKSTQDGTPTPDAPVPIVSAGDSGSVAVTLSDGKGKTQTLTLSTPNGLPGIPVTSGGNYIDPQGQQWVCDEVDLTRGVRVQRVYKVDVDGENVKFVQAGNYANISTRGLPIALYDVGQRTFAIATFTNLPWYYNTFNGQFLYLIAANLADQLNESCKKQLGKIYYALATPIETPLTPDEIAAYKALTAYGPDTVVQAGDGAGVKLVYQRDVNIAIKKLEDAVASMTAN